MATSSICTSCLSALRHQVRSQLRTKARTIYPQSIAATRPFSSSPLQLNEDVKKKPTPPPAPKPHELDKKPQSTSSAKDPIRSFAASVRQSETLRSTTEPYVAYGTTETLFAECNRQVNYTVPSQLKDPPEPPQRTAAGEDLGEGEGWWYRPKTEGGLGLDVTFNTWAQVMYLHMYMLTVRLRCFPEKHARIWHQQLLDHFFYAAEDRMAMWHGMVARGVRNKYLKDLWLQWRGILLSYDEGLINGDAVLAAAIWRNVFKASEGTDVADLALVTAYMRQQLKMLDGLSDQEIAEGRVKFGDPGQLKGLVGRESKWMSKPLTQEEMKKVEEKVAS